MKNSEIVLPKRKRTRLKRFDYSSKGAYFITICTKERKCLLGKIVGDGVLDVPYADLSDYGKIIENQINTMDKLYNNISVDKYVIMPNHIHLIVMVTGDGLSGTPAPTNAVIPHFVSTLKRYCNKYAGFDIFQRSFHDHIIRDQKDYLKIWNYIDSNPAKWQDDCFYIN